MTYIPEKLTAVSYCDGDISQMDAIKSGTDLFIDNKVIANKQHASRSGVEQPADLAKVFKLIKNMLPSYTVKNVPAERCPMKASISCPRANKRGINGTFENLQMIVGAGWDPTSSCAKMLDRSWENGGLLIFNERESTQIRSSMGKGMTDLQKFHDMYAYQFEMGYDLAISPGCNVSRSPGFESVLGIYGGQE